MTAESVMSKALLRVSKKLDAKTVITNSRPIETLGPPKAKVKVLKKMTSIAKIAINCVEIARGNNFNKANCQALKMA